MKMDKAHWAFAALPILIGLGAIVWLLLAKPMTISPIPTPLPTTVSPLPSPSVTPEPTLMPSPEEPVATATPTKVVDDPMPIPTATLSPTEPPSPTAEPTLDYVVVPIFSGDTLNKISLRCYAAESLWGPIVDRTNELAGQGNFVGISNPDLIRAGKDLAVPKLPPGLGRNHGCFGVQ